MSTTQRLSLGLARRLFTACFFDLFHNNIDITMDDWKSSSPDPLGVSDENFHNVSSSKPKRPSISPRKPLINTAGNAHVQDFYVTTPPAGTRKSRYSKDSKQRKNTGSPWRIRLTVQAEQVDGNDTGASSAQFTEKTTTTTVPLNDEISEPSSGKRGRGRPRKSLDVPLKRNGTPNSKAKSRRRTLPYLQDTMSQGAWAPTPPKRGGPKGRKSDQGQHEASSSFADISSCPTTTPTSQRPERMSNMKPISKFKNKSRRKEITPMKIPKQFGLDSTSTTDVPSTKAEFSQLTLDQRSSPMTSQRTDEQNLQRSNRSLPPNNICQPASSLDRSTLDLEDEKMWRSMIRQDSVSPADRKTSFRALCQSIDPTEIHQEYDTILESEGFSMVSVESLHSSGSQIEKQFHGEECSSKIQPIRHSSTNLSSATSPISQDDSGSSQNLRSQTLASVDNDPASKGPSSASKTPLSKFRTPEISMDTLSPPSRPALSSPHVSQRSIDEFTNGTPKIERVIRAGTALQAVPSPEEQGPIRSRNSLASPFNKSKTLSRPTETSLSDSKERGSSLILSDQAAGIYDGFSAATKRELKAGLRLGEELAKKQRASLPLSDQSRALRPSDGQAQTSPTYPKLPVIEPMEAYVIKKTSPDQDVKYAFCTNDQLPSPEMSEVDQKEYRGNWEVKGSFGIPQASPNIDNFANPENPVDYTMLVKEAEWQREREAVSKQIQEANSSQVIVIDSGDEDAESERPSSAFLAPSIEGGTLGHNETSNGRLRQLELKSNVRKLNRSMLSSPSRRNSEIVHSDEVQPNESDIFWQPSLAQTEAAKKRQERKRYKETAHEESALSATISNSRGCSSSGSTPTATAPGTPAFEFDSATHDCNTNLTAILKTPTSDKGSTFDRTYYEDSEELSDDDSKNLSDESESTEDVTEGSIQPTAQLVDTEASISLAQHESAASVPLPESPKLVPIDPELFASPKEGQIHTEPKPTEAEEAIKTSKSWFTSFTAPFSSLFASKFPLPPVTELDLLVAFGTNPLPLYRPWTQAHARILQGLFHVSVFYTPELLPYKPRSYPAYLLGATIRTEGGWARKITRADCGVIDAFIVLLCYRGVEPEGGLMFGEHISTREIARRLVEYWVSLVMSGTVKVGDWKGAKIGMRRAGDRIWRQEDIDWSQNKNRWLEAKRRDFEKYGLPSWGEKGLKGPFKLPEKVSFD